MLTVFQASFLQDVEPCASRFISNSMNLTSWNLYPEVVTCSYSTLTNGNRARQYQEICQMILTRLCFALGCHKANLIYIVEENYCTGVTEVRERSSLNRKNVNWISCQGINSMYNTVHTPNPRYWTAHPSYPQIPITAVEIPKLLST